MKTLFVGGGRGCLAVLQMVVNKRLAALSPEVLGVVDPSPEAPGVVYAKQQGWATFSNLKEAIDSQELELVIEVTGIDEVREEVARLVPDSVRIMDSSMARVFWDMDGLAENLREQLDQKTQLETEMREEQRQLQELLDSIPDAVMVVDENKNIIKTNRRFEQNSGLSVEEVVGLGCHDLFYGSCDSGPNNSDICPAQRVLDTRKPLTVVQENCCLRGDCEGEECHYEIVASPIKSSGGGTHIVITSREITDQVRMARETEEQARRARQILSTVRAAITITDMSGRHNFVNPSAEKFFGIRADEFMGQTLTELFPPLISSVIDENDREFRKTGEGFSREETVIVGEEERVLITERVMLVDYKDKPVGVCRVSRDVTSSRRLHQELLESEKHAAVGKLAAGVAHELNNPLTGILSFSEDLMEDAPKDSMLYQDLEVILRESIRCRRIVRDLLDFSRQTQSEFQAVAIDDIISKAVKLVAKQAAFHDVALEVGVAEKSLFVQVDPNKIQQLILNLIINARDAMDGKGKIAIKTEEQTNMRLVVVTVTDDGCGIDRDVLEKIFEPFFSTKGDRGNGLGLAAVQSIASEHGGSVAVKSEIGVGTTFTVFLPASGAKRNKNVSKSPSTFPAYHDWNEN